MDDFHWDFLTQTTFKYEVSCVKRWRWKSSKKKSFPLSEFFLLIDRGHRNFFKIFFFKKIQFLFYQMVHWYVTTNMLQKIAKYYMYFRRYSHFKNWNRLCPPYSLSQHTVVTAAFGWLRVEIILGLYLLGQAYWVNLLMFFFFLSSISNSPHSSTYKLWMDEEIIDILCFKMNQLLWYFSNVCSSTASVLLKVVEVVVVYVWMTIVTNHVQSIASLCQVSSDNLFQ